MSDPKSSTAAYYNVAIVLMLLLAATIAVARVDLGPWNTPIALTIAVAKALLVMVYFMHLRLASNLVRFFAAAGFFWFAILIALSLTDYLTRLRG